MATNEEESEREKGEGISRHGFGPRPEVALAHYEEQHGKPEGKLRVD